ncbi:MAG: NrfD/PsrC family molybdoenzyme membrane anchor subunit [Anaerolineales bacterium]|jgi:molybdopterin-containing oxidoreductase family membrane subunit|nr:NrfD/PsrC family molybdoenzyme membrane anchor subunit [Anaerolineales bacterium]
MAEKKNKNAAPEADQELKQEIPQKPAAPRRQFKLTTNHILWIVGILALLIGSIGMYQRLTEGLRLTALGSYVPWGLWVATYEYLVWLEVGSLLVFTLLVYVFNWPRDLERMAPTLYLSALAILAMALILIGLDLGHPFRFWHVLVWPQWGSLMTWMIWLHQVYLVVLVAKLALIFLPQRAFYKKISRWLSFLSLPLGIALVVIAGSVFGVVIGRPAWQGSGLPVLFLISSLVAGTGLLAFQYVWFMRTPSEEYIEVSRRLGKLLLAFLVISLLVSALTTLVILYPGVPAQATALSLTLFGPFWWVYWIFHLGFGVVLPIILLATQTQTARRIGVAAGLLIATYIAVPLNIVIPTQLAIDVVEKGLIIAFQGPGLKAYYFPTTSEWLVTLFALAFGYLVFLFGFTVLGMRPKVENSSEEVVK